MKYKNANGTKMWHSRRGSIAAKEANRLDALVKKGIASRWSPLRSVGGALEAAGLV